MSSLTPNEPETGAQPSVGPVGNTGNSTGPHVSLEVPERKADIQTDAKHRAFRTLVQNLAVDLLVAVVVFLYPVFASSELTDIQWAALGLALAKTLIVTGLSYAMRVLRVSPSTVN